MVLFPKSLYVALGAALLLGATVQASDPAVADENGPAWNADMKNPVPMDTVTVGSSDTAKMPDGSYRTWLVSNAKPAMLVEVDTRTGKALRHIDMVHPDAKPDAIGAWGITTADDGTVFTSSHTSGAVFYLKPGESKIQASPRPTSTTSFIWQVDTDEQGRVYGGTFEGWGEPVPQGRLFRFDPHSNEMKVYEPFAEDDIYVRGTAYVDGFVYAGTGSASAKLYKVNAETGEPARIELPDGLEGKCEFVYELSNVDRWLSVYLSGCPSGKIGYIYDTKERTWSAPLADFNNANIDIDSEGRLWFTLSSVLHSYDPEKKDLKNWGAVMDGGKATQVYIDEQGRETVVAMNYSGAMDRFVIDTEEFITGSVLDLRGDRNLPVFTAEVGPDDKLYASVSFGGGLAIYDPKANEWESHGEWKRESESMLSFKGKMYIGTYPTARLYEYDPKLPFGPQNPKELFSLGVDEQQDRPWALAAVGDWIAIGTVANYGMVQGGLTLYNPETSERVTLKEELLPGRGATALAAIGDVVFVGTTEKGGNGTPPPSNPGTVVAYDREKQRKLWESTPVPGETGVTSLVATPSGRLFGIAFNTAFELDPNTGKVLRTQKLDEVAQPANGFWRSAHLKYDRCENRLYTTLNNRIYQIDPDSLEGKEINSGKGTGRGSRMLITSDGTKWWFNGRILVSGRTYPEGECPNPADPSLPSDPDDAVSEDPDDAVPEEPDVEISEDAADDDSPDSSNRPGRSGYHPVQAVSPGLPATGL